MNQQQPQQPAVDPLAPLADAIAEKVVQKLRQQTAPENTVSERLLTADEAAQLLAVSPDWLYRNSKRLPFARKLAPKMLRFSYQGLLKWSASRKPN